MKPVRRFLWSKEQAVQNILPGRSGRYPIEAPGNESYPQITPWAASRTIAPSRPWRNHPTRIYGPSSLSWGNRSHDGSSGICGGWSSTTHRMEHGISWALWPALGSALCNTKTIPREHYAWWQGEGLEGLHSSAGRWRLRNWAVIANQACQLFSKRKKN